MTPDPQVNRGEGRAEETVAFMQVQVPDTREGWKAQAEYLANEYNALADRWSEQHDRAESAEKQRDEAEAERDEAREWVARLLQLEIPPRNEPGMDEATRQAAREELARWQK